MSTLKQFKADPSITFKGAGLPSASTVGAKKDDLYLNETTGELFRCAGPTVGSQIWRGSQGTVAGAAILAFDHPNLVAMYTMDNISGSTLLDESPNNRDGTITGATQVTGKLGNALSHDGVDDITDCGFHPQGTSGAFSLWLKSPATGSGVPVCLSDATDPKVNIVFGLGSTTDTYNIYHNRGPITANFISSTDTFPGDRGVWVHLVYQSTGSDWEIYRNGTKLPTTLNDGSPGSWWDAISGNTNLTLAGRNSLNITERFNVEIDQFRLFNRHLAPAEVANLYNGGVGV